MSKARKCDWCGKKIAAKEIRVKLPVMYEGPAMTYHAKCYCQVYDRDCLRFILEGTGDFALGPHLAAVLATLDPKNDEDDW